MWPTILLALAVGPPQPDRLVIISTAYPDLMRRELTIVPWLHCYFRVEYEEPRSITPEWRIGKNGVRHAWPTVPAAPKLFVQGRPAVRGCVAWALAYELYQFVMEDVLDKREYLPVVEFPPGAKSFRERIETPEKSNEEAAALGAAEKPEIAPGGRVWWQRFRRIDGGRSVERPNPD